MTTERDEINCINYNMKIAKKSTDAGNYEHSIGYHENIIRSLKSLLKDYDLEEDKKAEKVLIEFLELDEKRQERLWRRIKYIYE